MRLYKRYPSMESLLVTDLYRAKLWVNARMGDVTNINVAGSKGTLHNSTRLPVSFTETREPNYMPVSVGEHIVHDGNGQFRVYTKEQFNYWFEEQE